MPVAAAPRLVKRLPTGQPSRQPEGALASDVQEHGLIRALDVDVEAVGRAGRVTGRVRPQSRRGVDPRPR